MYGLPEDIDLNFLMGKRLIQICISTHQIIMRFDDDITISVESAIKLFDDKGDVHLYEDNRSINQDLLMLLENSISDVISNKTGTLILHFDNGNKVELNDDSAKYESYQIVGDGQTIVV